MVAQRLIQNLRTRFKKFASNLRESVCFAPRSDQWEAKFITSYAFHQSQGSCIVRSYGPGPSTQASGNIPKSTAHTLARAKFFLRLSYSGVYANISVNSSVISSRISTAWRLRPPTACLLRIADVPARAARAVQLTE
ncbi:hypothetical protein ACJJTC_012286 [Scirpophaga incertulas]